MMTLTGHMKGKLVSAKIALLVPFSVFFIPQALASTTCPNTTYGWEDGRGGTLGESIMNISMNRPECYCKFNTKWIIDQMGRNYYADWENTCKKRQ